MANIVPVYKSGDPSLVSNYRPISLLCCISKVLERCVYNYIYPLVKDCITENQFGFLPKHSTTLQLLKVYNDIHMKLDANSQIDVIFLDLSKAFDTVPHDLLIVKLKKYGFSGNLLDWFRNYTTGRKQQVVLDGCMSDKLPVKSGVPQGSILGPLLFLLYINDLEINVNNSKLALFADDTKLYREINDINDSLLLQHDLDRVADWSRSWGLTFNESKCTHMSISRKSCTLNCSYHLNHITISKVYVSKDLGILIDNHLKFDQHIQQSVLKANRVLWMLKRSIVDTNCEIKKLFYVSLVRPILEYGSQLWSPYMKKHVYSIESVQRSASRFILNYQELNYDQRLRSLKLLPLMYRREFLDIMLFYKIFHNKTPLNISDFFTLNVNERYDVRVSNDIYVPFARTEQYRNSFFVRVLHLWNKLPRDIRNIDFGMSGSFFKRKLKLFFENKLNNEFVADNYCTWSIDCRCTSCRPR